MIILCVIAITISATFGVSANEILVKQYNVNNVTVIFDTDSQFTIEQQKSIVNFLVNSQYGVAQANIICNIFGHKNTSETVISITHKVFEESPRCMQENFTVTNCSRCDETTVVRNSFAYISCCPED